MYQQKLNSIIYIIIDSGAEAEECGNLIHSVWYNAIFYVSNTDTDKYTKRTAVLMMISMIRWIIYIRANTLQKKFPISNVTKTKF